MQNTKQNITAVIPFISGISLLVFEGRQNILFASVTSSLPSTSFLHRSEARGAMQRSLLKIQACSAVRMPAERPRDGMFCFGGTYLSTPFRNHQLIPWLILRLGKSPQPVTGCPCQTSELVCLYTCCLFLISTGAAQTHEAGAFTLGSVSGSSIGVLCTTYLTW